MSPVAQSMLEALSSRRSQITTRIVLAVILAVAFFPNTGLVFAACWLVGYLVIQLFEWAWLSPAHAESVVQRAEGRQGVIALIFISNVIFGLFGVREALSGEPTALACASLLLAGASFNAVLTSHHCRPLLLAALIPSALFNMAVPLGAWMGGSSLLHTGLLVLGVLLYYMIILQALRLVRQVFEAERRLREAAEAAEAARARMVANVSHELRTPLNAVIASASLLRRAALNDRDAEAVGHLTSGAATLQALISDILDASKAEAGHMELLQEPFDVVATLRTGSELFRASAEAKGLALVFESDIDQAWVIGDAMRLGQILSNLCNNAIKFTAEGEIRVRLTVASGGDVRCVTLEVRDSGIGMDCETAARMFQPFTQADASTARQYGGTGLGLSISKTLSEAMNGDLTVQSERGQGSTFRLTAVLPAAAPVEASTPLIPQSTETAWTSGRPQVLVADDNLANRRLMMLILADQCEVTAVEDGAKALALIAECHFDLFITDMQMPIMDGPAALAELRRREAGTGHRLPALLATADAQIAASVAEAMGADGVLTKPFTATDLLDAVARRITTVDQRQAA